MSKPDGVLEDFSVTSMDVCVVCGCRLTPDNVSESPNVCFDCLRVLER